MLAIDPDTGIPGTLQDPDRAMVVITEFFHSDAFRIPGHTPGFNGEALHPMAGQQVRVSLAFKSFDPTGVNQGHEFTHLWCKEADLGVAETPSGFIVYQASTFPEEWPKLGLEVRRGV